MVGSVKWGWDFTWTDARAPFASFQTHWLDITLTNGSDSFYNTTHWPHFLPLPPLLFFHMLQEQEIFEFISEIGRILICNFRFKSYYYKSSENEHNKKNTSLVRKS